jgi:ADP-heptose:LPS heptosyltransferase
VRPEDAAPRRRILVIKLGAIGDFVQAMAPAAAIRAFHRAAKITLLTGPLCAELGRGAPYFDEVWVDDRPGLTRPLALWRLRRRLKSAGFERVYDLQTSDRSSWYFHLMGPGARPEWSGIARGASHRHTNPNRDHMHTLDRQAEQLRMAGIPAVPPVDLAWAAPGLNRFALPDGYLLLVPGGSAHRPAKRWPVANYAALARRAAAAGVTPVIIGGPDEAALGAAILALCPLAHDLTGKTGFGDLVALGARAVHAVGNDTGPMHLVVAGGAPATILYSAASNPALTAPRGACVTILRRADLATLGVEDVAATLPFG